MKNIFRYERKFIINNLTIPELENISFRLSKNSKYVNSLMEHPNRII